MSEAGNARLPAAARAWGCVVVLLLGYAAAFAAPRTEAGPAPGGAGSRDAATGAPDLAPEAGGARGAEAEAAPGGDGDLAAALRAIPMVPHANPASPYYAGLPLSRVAQDSLTEEVELRGHRDGMSFVWTGSAIQQQDSLPTSNGVLNEAVLDRDWGGMRWSVGKKVMSWDVGFGFRPLDVVQQENRRALLVYALEGIPGVSAESYGADSAWTFVLANPARGEAKQPRDDASVAARYYRRIEGVDGYAVARLSRRDEAQAGASFAWIINDNLEWHASGLYQRRYELTIDGLVDEAGAVLARGDPLATVARHDAALALVGASLSGEAGWSVLAEAWHDGTAYERSDWLALQTLDARQLALALRPGVPAAALAANLAFSSSYYLPSNLLRENLLLHASYKIDKLTPALDVLETPADGGVVATASAEYEGNRGRIDVGLRLLTGRTGSVYRQAPANRIFYLGASWFL